MLLGELLLSEGRVELLPEVELLLSDGDVVVLEGDVVLVLLEGEALLPLLDPECSGAPACSSRESLPSPFLSSVAKSFSCGVPATSSRDR